MQERLIQKCGEALPLISNERLHAIASNSSVYSQCPISIYSLSKQPSHHILRIFRQINARRMTADDEGDGGDVAVEPRDHTKSTPRWKQWIHHRLLWNLLLNAMILHRKGRTQACEWRCPRKERNGQTPFRCLAKLKTRRTRAPDDHHALNTYYGDLVLKVQCLEHRRRETRQDKNRRKARKRDVVLHPSPHPSPPASPIPPTPQTQGTNHKARKPRDPIISRARDTKLRTARRPLSPPE